MPPVRFEPTISVGGRPQNYALDRAATVTGILIIIFQNNLMKHSLYIEIHPSATFLALFKFMLFSTKSYTLLQRHTVVKYYLRKQMA